MGLIRSVCAILYEQCVVLLLLSTVTLTLALLLNICSARGTCCAHAQPSIQASAMEDVFTRWQLLD